MSEGSIETTVKLIRTIIQNLDGPVVDWDGWESFAIIVDSFDGKFNSASGYLYSADGTISAVSTPPRNVIPVVDEYMSGYFKPDEKLPVKFLVEFDRTSGKYNITFEDTDEMRWKITPSNYKELREELRPQLA